MLKPINVHKCEYRILFREKSYNMLLNRVIVNSGQRVRILLSDIMNPLMVSGT